TPPYSTYVFPVTDLDRPALVLTTGAYPRALAFDPRGGRIYAQNHQHQLLVYTAGGIKQKEYRLGDAEAKQLLVHPAGGKLLVLTGERLYRIDVPGGAAGPAGPGSKG